jgi:hypothetical protein
MLMSSTLVFTYYILQRSRTATAGRPGGGGGPGAETAPQRTPPPIAARTAPLRPALQPKEKRT